MEGNVWYMKSLYIDVEVSVTILIQWVHLFDLLYRLAVT